MFTITVQFLSKYSLLVVHAFFDVVVTDLFDDLSGYLLVVDLGFGRDFSENHAHVVLYTALTSHFRMRVLSQARVQN
jgi:hypothetical protein